MTDTEDESTQLNHEKQFALVREKKRIEFLYASRVAQIPTDVEEPELRQHVREAILNLTAAEQKALEMEKKERYARIRDEYEELEEKEPLIEKHDIDTE